MKLKMFLITLLGGFFGVHRFIRGQKGLGILYLLTFGIFGIGWVVDCVIAFKNMNKSTYIKFKVRSWGIYLDNISMWQNANARDQWVGATYSSKNLYQYSWMSNVDDLVLKPEPQNEYSKDAIAVYLGSHKIGYVPNPVNKQYYKKLIKAKEIKADIYSGDSKYIDRHGDLIVDKRDPIVDITVLI